MGAENNGADLFARSIKNIDLDYGYWWIELGGDRDAVREGESLRFELLAVVMGVWDYIKNSGKYPEAANRAIDFIGMLPGRRDTFRVEGEYIMRQSDIEGGWKNFADSVAIGGWSMDDHPSAGFNAKTSKPCRQIRNGVYSYNIPLGSLISKDVKNLMMAGRDISCSHVAFSSTRVMATCANVGQAAGTAAAQCARHGITPAELRASASRVAELQQALLRGGQVILGLKNEDPADLARSAKVRASSCAENSSPESVIDGVCIDAPNSFAHKWAAEAAKKPSITLSWEAPVEISKVRVQFYSGCVRLAQYSRLFDLRGMPRQPAPEIARDYTVEAELEGGLKKTLARVEGNWQRLNEISFAPVKVKSITLKIEATNGSPLAAVYEIRAEA